MGLPHVALDWFWHCISVVLLVFIMMHCNDCDIVNLCSYGSSSCCIWLIVTMFICVLMVLPHVALDWFWHCISVVLLVFIMMHLFVTMFICVLIGLPHLALDWLWHCLSVCSHGSSSCCIRLIVTSFICVLMVLPHVALDWLWHCLSVISWSFLILPCIDCDIVNLCSQWSSSFCLGLVLALFICGLVVLHHDAFDCDIVYLCSHGSSSCCIRLIVTLFICVLMILPHAVYLCSQSSSSCCIGLIVTLFVFVLEVLPLLICVLMGLPHVALDWFWHCISVVLLVFIMMHCNDCDIVNLCSYGSSSCCIWLIVTMFICVLMVLPHVALDWLWHCLSVFAWVFLMLHWIGCDIVYLCPHGSSSCCIGLIVTMLTCVLMGLPHVALEWLWHC